MGRRRGWGGFGLGRGTASPENGRRNEHGAEPGDGIEVRHSRLPSASPVLRRIVLHGSEIAPRYFLASLDSSVGRSAESAQSIGGGSFEAIRRNNHHRR